jgi:hypothetical protein
MTLLSSDQRSDLWEWCNLEFWTEITEGGVALTCWKNVVVQQKSIWYLFEYDYRDFVKDVSINKFNTYRHLLAIKIWKKSNQRKRIDDHVEDFLLDHHI